MFPAFCLEGLALEDGNERVSQNVGI